VRVRNDDLGIDVMFELLPRGGLNEVDWRFGSEAAFGVRGSTYYAEQWSEVARPAGMSEAEFDRAVLNAAVVESQRVVGKKYRPEGQFNSNRFVYDVLKRAGSAPPRRAERGSGAPGLCGGTSYRTGDDCTP
jgi:hypothetical protein